jgi:hypothetical protein
MQIAGFKSPALQNLFQAGRINFLNQHFYSSPQISKHQNNFYDQKVSPGLKWRKANGGVYCGNAA